MIIQQLSGTQQLQASQHKSYFIEKITPVRRMRHCLFILAIIVLPAARSIEVAPMRDLEKVLVFTSFLVLFEESQFSESDLVHLVLSFRTLACTINMQF